MAVGSPLGKYAQIVAVVVVLATIGSWILAVLSDNSSAADQLKDFTILAFGAVLGSVAAVNGIKPDIAAANRRVDIIEQALPGVDTHAALSGEGK